MGEALDNSIVYRIELKLSIPKRPYYTRDVATGQLHPVNGSYVV